MANTYLTRTPSSTGNRKIFTTSFWMKRSKLGGQQPLFSTDLDNTNNNYTMFYLDGGDGIGFFNTDGGVSNVDYLTNRKLRDTNSWYHIVIVFDSTQSSGNRIKFYINGVRETSFANSTEPNQDADNTWFNRTYEHMIGTRSYDTSTYFDGSLSYFNFIDGTAYDASAFGSTDSTTGEWQINTSPSVTYGTNGFFILKDGNSVTDQSGNSNNWTVGGGTLTKTEDCPSNVFATLNPLNVPTSNAPTFSNGNNTSITSSATGSYKWGGSTTLGMTSGKFYCEAKATVDSTYSRSVIGITGDSTNLATTNGSILGTTASCGYYSSNGSVQYNGSGDISGFNTSYTTGDIISMAFDLDNGKLYFRKNNDAWQNSGDPTSGATGTGAVSILSASTTSDGAYFFAQTDDTGTSSPSKFEFNFGNGYFGTTAVASAGTPGSTPGTFEYDVPSGYQPLSTKGLNA